MVAQTQAAVSPSLSPESQRKLEELRGLFAGAVHDMRFAFLDKVSR